MQKGRDGKGEAVGGGLGLGKYLWGRGRGEVSRRVGFFFIVRGFGCGVGDRGRKGWTRHEATR